MNEDNPHTEPSTNVDPTRTPAVHPADDKYAELEKASMERGRQVAAQQQETPKRDTAIERWDNEGGQVAPKPGPAPDPPRSKRKRK